MENNINQLKKKSSIKTSSSAKRYYIKSLIAIAVFLLVITLELVNNGGYFDEIIGVLSAIYLIFFRTRIERRDMYTLIIMGIVVAIGVISNLVSGVSHNYFSIVIDIVAETKLLFAYFAMKYFLNDEEKKATINMLVSLAKLFTIGAFVCSIISLFTDIGMTGPKYSVIGMNIKASIKRFETTLPERYKIAEGKCILNAVIFEIDDNTSKVTNIKRIYME